MYSRTFVNIQHAQYPVRVMPLPTPTLNKVQCPAPGSHNQFNFPVGVTILAELHGYQEFEDSPVTKEAEVSTHHPFESPENPATTPDAFEGTAHSFDCGYFEGYDSVS
jgi:hypothetical protein